MKSIIIIIDYLGGKWPEWFPLFLESCRKNPDISWLIHTDAPTYRHDVPNVTLRYCNANGKDYRKLYMEGLKSMVWISELTDME